MIRSRPYRPHLDRLEDRALMDVGFRSIDGSGNNLANPDWGSTDVQLLRRAPSAYGGNGLNDPAGADRLSPREISNGIVAHDPEEIRSDRQMSAWIYVWGQFLDHDLDLTQPPVTGAEAFNIPVPTGDRFFDPTGQGGQYIFLNRSRYDPTTGINTPRQQINQITAFIDASMVYGSDQATADSLRTFIGGRLKMSDGDMPPTDAAGNFLAGDVRANENIELTSVHTLFLREHNRIADQIATNFPWLTDEQIYQRARARVGAEIEVITYKEWLPALLGPNALPAYAGYNPNVNPGIANEFSTAGFRLGHSLINNDVEFFGNDGRPLRDEVELKDAFFNPALLRETGIDGIMKYAASAQSEEIDNQIVDGLRNFLFGNPGQGGFDLASLNIQRGRDHGLADYNTVRAAYGLPRVTDFSDITSDTKVQNSLRNLYGTVDNIDLWVGALAEDHVAGGSVGPLIRRIVVDQFTRVRDGDRFWFARVFSGGLLAQLQATTLADVIERNTTVNNLQDNVFFMRAEVRGRAFFDRDGDGKFDFGEVALPNVHVDLLNADGVVIASTVTDLLGRYRFTQIAETGDYQVRIVVSAQLTVTTPNPAQISFSRGDQVIAGVNFGIRLTDRSTAGSFVNELIQILGLLGP
ncbi:MAG TPA: peroxidase family protein [Gemmataceae bacterium]|nr:peroxidase family protein [Gemmataceae bacterium]